MGIVSVFHLLDQVVPVDQNVPDGTNPLLHEGHVSEDLQLLFLALSFERVGDADKVTRGTFYRKLKLFNR